jgi:hypothetical protein
VTSSVVRFGYWLKDRRMRASGFTRCWCHQSGIDVLSGLRAKTYESISYHESDGQSELLATLVGLPFPGGIEFRAVSCSTPTPDGWVSRRETLPCMMISPSEEKFPGVLTGKFRWVFLTAGNDQDDKFCIVAGKMHASGMQQKTKKKQDTNVC